MFNLYKGSDLLLPFSESVNLHLDQVNFIACQVFSLLFGILFRIAFKPSVVGPKVRHVVEAVVGFLLLFFCFGIQALCLIVQSLVSYLIMNQVRPGISEKLVFVFSMLFLGACHSYRLYSDYAGYTLDITGPMMINTQRISALAFSYSDGALDTIYAKDKAIRKMPSLLELLSYTLSFHMVICGPFVFFNEYMDFIEGNVKDEGRGPPQPLKPLLIKLFSSLANCYLYLIIDAHYNPVGLLEPQILSESSKWYVIFYVVMATFAVRCKYYFAWKLADAVNVSAGMGFNGYDDKGNEKWDIVDTVDILNVEFATSMKTIFASWNKVSSVWLRHIVYERTKSTLGVFMVSAYWHGFYPGYYISFAGGAFFIILSRMIRQRIRSYFQVYKTTSIMYDILTFMITKVLVSYLVLPFLLLELNKIMDFYMSLYFIPHIIGVVLFILLKLLSLVSPERKSDKLS